jgi:DNA-binding MarR family transcriptional regulator
MGGMEGFEAEELAGLLAGIQRLARRRLLAGLTGLRLRGAEVELLRIVSAEPGISVNGAARQLHLAGNSVSTLVNRLVKAGLLVRTPDPADRRAARLEITEAATQRLAAWRKRRGELFTELLGELTAAERAVLREAVPALRHLAENLSKEVARG